MKKYLITVNGSKYEVEVEEITGGETVKYNVLETAKEKIPQEAAPVQKSTAASSAAASTAAAAAGNAAASPAPGKQEKEAFKSSEVPSGAQTVTAPMPGVILSVNVNNGFYNFTCMSFSKSAANYGKILGSYKYRPAVNCTMTCNYTIARHFFALHSKISAPTFYKYIHFNKTFLIQEH